LIKNDFHFRTALLILRSWPLYPRENEMKCNRFPFGAAPVLANKIQDSTQFDPFWAARE